MVSYKGFDVKCITMTCLNSEPEKIEVGDYVTADQSGNALKLAR